MDMVNRKVCCSSTEDGVMYRIHTLQYNDLVIIPWFLCLRMISFSKHKHYMATITINTTSTLIGLVNDAVVQVDDNCIRIRNTNIYFALASILLSKINFEDILIIAR